jgi:hypothetical protein
MQITYLVPKNISHKDIIKNIDLLNSETEKEPYLEWFRENRLIVKLIAIKGVNEYYKYVGEDEH